MYANAEFGTSLQDFFPEKQSIPNTRKESSKTAYSQNRKSTARH